MQKETAKFSLIFNAVELFTRIIFVEKVFSLNNHGCYSKNTRKYPCRLFLTAASQLRVAVTIVETDDGSP